MIKNAGYPAEAHVTLTNDGYLLTLHRIPGSKDSLPVLLQHGFLCSSADWIIPGKDKGLGILQTDFKDLTISDAFRFKKRKFYKKRKLFNETF